MNNPRNKHGTMQCVSRFINGNRAGPLINVHTRSRAPATVFCVRQQCWFLPEMGEVRADGISNIE